ncbi:MAG: hypothetical protein M3146_01935 [Thermoproteota archaeon]|nr:hypothetical protein [Thermoproteota archaeon]
MKITFKEIFAGFIDTLIAIEIMVKKNSDNLILLGYIAFRLSVSKVVL